MRWSLTPLTNLTQSESPSRSRVSAALPSSLGLPMMISSTWRSVRSLATASSRKCRPFIATSALAVVIRRPGTRDTPATGRNSSGSTPTGTTWIRSRGTWWSRWMSRLDDSETVMTRVMRLATWVCIRVKEYQRRLPKRSRRVRACSISSLRSTVIG